MNPHHHHHSHHQQSNIYGLSSNDAGYDPTFSQQQQHHQQQYHQPQNYISGTNSYDPTHASGYDPNQYIPSQQQSLYGAAVEQPSATASYSSAGGYQQQYTSTPGAPYSSSTSSSSSGQQYQPQQAYSAAGYQYQQQHQHQPTQNPYSAAAATQSANPYIQSSQQQQHHHSAYGQQQPQYQQWTHQQQQTNALSYQHQQALPSSQQQFSGGYGTMQQAYHQRDVYSPYEQYDDPHRRRYDDRSDRDRDRDRDYRDREYRDRRDRRDRDRRRSRDRDRDRDGQREGTRMVLPQPEIRLDELGDMCRIDIQNIPELVDYETVKSWFAKYGDVERFYRVPDRDSKDVKSADVIMKNLEQGSTAVANLDGREVVVHHGKPSEQRRVLRVELHPKWIAEHGDRVDKDAILKQKEQRTDNSPIIYDPSTKPFRDPSAFRDKYEDGIHLFVIGIPTSYPDEDVHKMFEKFGKVRQYQRRYFSDVIKGARIVMENINDALAAIDALNRKELRTIEKIKDTPFVCHLSVQLDSVWLQKYHPDMLKDHPRYKRGGGGGGRSGDDRSGRDRRRSRSPSFDRHHDGASQESQREPPKLQVTGIHRNTTDSEVRSWFSENGVVKDVKLFVNPDMPDFQRADITMSTVDDCNKAISNLHRKDMVIYRDGQQLAQTLNVEYHPSFLPVAEVRSHGSLSPSSKRQKI